MYRRYNHCLSSWFPCAFVSFPDNSNRYSALLIQRKFPTVLFPRLVASLLVPTQFSVRLRLVCHPLISFSLINFSFGSAHLDDQRQFSCDFSVCLFVFVFLLCLFASFPESFFSRLFHWANLIEQIYSLKKFVFICCVLDQNCSNKFSWTNLIRQIVRWKYLFCSTVWLIKFAHQIFLKQISSPKFAHLFLL